MVFFNPTLSKLWESCADNNVSRLCGGAFQSQERPYLTLWARVLAVAETVVAQICAGDLCFSTHG